MTPKEKGSALERATRSIYELLLKKQGFGESELWIELNHRFLNGGARHEIDVLFRISPNTPSERKWVIECKNRKAKASKSDIVILEDKVRMLSAEKGILVARCFTKDAKALAEHRGIEMEQVADKDWLPEGLVGFAGATFAFHSLNIRIARFGDDQPIPEPNWLKEPCRWRSSLHDFGQVVRDLIHEEMMDRPEAKYRMQGMIPRHDTVSYEFAPNELWVGGWNIRFFNAEFDCSYSFRPAKLMSTFSIEKKGRVADFVCEPDPFNDDVMRIEVMGKF